MKKKDLNNLKSKDQSEINKKIEELEKDAINKKIELKMGKLKNFHKVKSIRKSIAQLKTMLVIKKLSQEEKTNKKGKLNEAN